MQNRIVVGLAAVAALLACTTSHPKGPDAGGGDSGQPAPDSGATPDSGPGPICTPSADLVAAGLSCHADDDCPCGAHCTLGRCGADCSSALDCDGGYCDIFGRCRALEDTSIVPALVPQTQANAVLRSRALSVPDLFDAGAVGGFTLNSAARAMRLGADEGLGLQCPGADDAGFDADGGFDCWFGPRDAGTVETFEVYPTTAFDGGETRGVTLFVDDQVQGITVTGTNPAPLPATPDVPAAGFYAGTIRLLDQGVSTDPAGVPPVTAVGDGGDPFTVPPAALVIPIQAELAARNGGLLLGVFDQTRLFGPSGQWVGDLQSDGGVLAFPDYRLVSETLVANGDGGADIEVILHAEPTAITLANGGGSFSFELDVSAVGVLGTGGPASRFLVSLAAVDGGVGPDAGLVAQTPYVAALSPSRAATPTTWEKVASAELAVPFAGGSEAAGQIESVLLDYWRVDGGGFVDGGVRLDACGRSDADLVALQSVAFYGALTTPQLVGASSLGASTDTVTIPAESVDTASTQDGPLLPIILGTFQNAVQGFGGAATALSGGTLALGIGNDGSQAGLGLSPRAIPCDLSLSTEAGIGLSVTIAGIQQVLSLEGSSIGTIQACDQLATTYGCAIEDQPAADNKFSGSFSLGGSGYTAFGVSNFGMGGVYQGTYARICVLPPNPPMCPQAWDCAVPTADPNAGVDSSLLTAVARANSGDLVCATGPFSETIAFDENNEPATPSALSASQMFTDCLSELEAASSTSPPPVGAPGTNSVKALLAQSPHCVDVQRLLLSLGSGYPETGAASLEIQALAARGFQRWIKLHTFLAQEALEQEGIGQILRQGGAPTAPPTLDASLRAVQSGWALLLHPRFAAILEGIDSQILVQSDYRALLYPEVRYPTGTDQGGGLPAAILQNLDATMHLAQIALREAWSAGRTSDIPQLTEVLREALVLRPLAYDLAARAQAEAAQTGANLSWLVSYQAIDESLAADLQAFQVQLSAFLAGRNPLGIEDSDLPLYFLGTNLGAGGQFAAVSDYLLGSGPGSNAWAPALVAQVTTDLTAAETAYQQQQDRILAQQEATADEANREEALETQYGSQILNLCGTFSNLPADQILDQAGNLDGHSCYYSSEADCHISDEAFAQQVTPDDIKYQLCLIGALKVSAGPNVQSGDPKLDQYAKLLAQVTEETEATFETTASAEAAAMKMVLDQLTIAPGGCSGSPAAYCLSSSRLSSKPPTDITAETFANTEVPQDQGGGGIPPDTTSEQDPDLPLGTLPSPVGQQTQTAQQVCQLAVPNANTNLPSIGELNPNLTNGTCYQGSLGQLALEVQTAVQSLDLAQSHYSDAESAYSSAGQTCLALQQQLMVTEQAAESQIQAQLEQVAAQVSASKQSVSTLSNVLSLLAQSARQDCVSGPGVAGVFAGIGLLFGFPPAGVGSIVNCLASKQQQAGLQQQLAAAQQQQKQLQQQLQTTAATLQAEDAAALQACAGNVAQYFLAVQNASTEVQQAVNAEINAQYQLNNQAQQVGLLLAEGRQALSVMRGHTVIPPDADFWLRSDIQTYERDFQLAQVATYLAERSVEYEYQVSLPDRAKTLAAQAPTDLSGVLEDLYLAAGSRQINGASPSDLEVVISLRDQLLQLADQSKLPADRLRLNPTQRFQMLLRSPKYASYDSQGNYLGQKIPFSLVPEGTLKIGNAQGITVLAGSDCAERLWNVNASVLGSEPLLYGNQNQVFTNIDLLKSNTFYSQWCGAPPASGPQFQVASVDPGRNLFEIPTLGAAVGNNFGVSSTETQTTTARIQAFFNVDATTFESASYDNGSTQELAARGLFGDYALFLPASTLSQSTPAGQTNGLILNNVSDILLRLDYVSVANGP